MSRGLLLSSCLSHQRAAVHDFIKAATLRPSWTDPHVGLALCHLEMGDNDSAIKQAEIAVALDGADASTHHLLGLCINAAAHHHAAKSHFEKATSLAPEDANYWTSLGSACRRTGELRRAVECYETAIALEATAMGCINIAGIRLEMCQISEAMESLESAKNFRLSEVEQLLFDATLNRARQMR